MKANLRCLKIYDWGGNMISITRTLDEYDIAQEIRLSRQVHKGTFLLLEGQTDVDRFVEYIDEIECSFVNCYGRHNATRATKILSEEGFPGIVAIVDADFDRVLGRLEEHENIIYSENHDLDMDWLKTNAFGRYLRQAGDQDKIDAIGSVDGVFQRIIDSLCGLSSLRLINVKRSIRFKLQNLKLENFYAPFQINTRLLAEDVFFGRDASDARIGELARLINKHAADDFDPLQMTNGHDFCSALGLCLRDAIGSRRVAQTWGSEVEMHLRLALNDNDFRATSVFRDILRWERENVPYIILDCRIRAPATGQRL